MGEYKETCPYCGNQYIMTDTMDHSLCKEYYQFMLSEKIAYAKQQLEMCLELQRKFKRKE